MRILYYTFPSLWDIALPFVAEISQKAEVHLLIQIHPGAWQTSMFDVKPVQLPMGITSAKAVLDALPGQLRAHLEKCTSHHLAVFTGKHAYYPTSLLGTVSVLQFIKHLKPDVIHFETTSGRLFWALKWLQPIPLIITVHDPEPHSGEAPIRKRIIRRLQYSQGAHFILHNRRQLKSFCEHYHVSTDKVNVIPLGVPEFYREWSESTEVSDGKTVLFFGRISPYKGIEDLFAAAPLVCDQISGVRFVIAGEAIPGYKLPTVPKLSAGGTFEIIQQYIPNHSLAVLFNQASLVVCPYRDATQSAVILTAYAFGKPVIATRVGGLPEYVDEGITGELVPPNDPILLAKAIIKILIKMATEQSASLRYQQAIDQKCRDELDWSHIAEQTLSVYKNAITSQKG